MILEVALLNIRPGDSADFEHAFAGAHVIIAAMAECGWGRSADSKTDKRTETDVRPASPEGISQ
jgi:hypothetical protein